MIYIFSSLSPPPPEEGEERGKRRERGKR